MKRDRHKIKWGKFSVLFAPWLTAEVRQKLSDLRAAGYTIGAAKEENGRRFHIGMRMGARCCEAALDEFELHECHADLLSYTLTKIEREFLQTK